MDDVNAGNQRIATVEALGFTVTYPLESDQIASGISVDSLCISCSQCAALVINGTPTHEHGCPNQTAECTECGCVIPPRHRYCDDCAENL